MSDGNLAFTGLLSNGVKYEVHCAEGFSNHSEVAIKIGGEFVTIVKVAPKRNGNIEVIPTTAGRTIIKNPIADSKPSAPTTADDEARPSSLLDDVVVAATPNTSKQ